MNHQKTLSVSSGQSIVIIQRAYELYCASHSLTKEYSTAWQHETQQIGPLETLTAFATEPPLEEWLKFQVLVARWQQERGVMSSITEAALCPSYQSIIGMGKVVVPFILTQLESEGAEPDQWFWALKSITGVDPVAEADRGNYVRMAQSWLEWGKSAENAW